jgi:hypothetical protein
VFWVCNSDNRCGHFPSNAGIVSPLRRPVDRDGVDRKHRPPRPNACKRFPQADGAASTTPRLPRARRCNLADWPWRGGFYSGAGKVVRLIGLLDLAWLARTAVKTWSICDPLGTALTGPCRLLFALGVVPTWLAFEHEPSFEAGSSSGARRHRTSPVTLAWIRPPCAGPALPFRLVLRLHASLEFFAPP